MSTGLLALLAVSGLFNIIGVFKYTRYVVWCCVSLSSLALSRCRVIFLTFYFPPCFHNTQHKTQLPRRDASLHHALS